MSNKQLYRVVTAYPDSLHGFKLGAVVEKVEGSDKIGGLLADYTLVSPDTLAENWFMTCQAQTHRTAALHTQSLEPHDVEPITVK